MVVNMDEYLDKMAHQQEKIDKLKSRIASDTEKVEKLEASLAKKRASVLKSTEKECIDICLDALVVGAGNMFLQHGDIAPYTTGYYVSDDEMYISKQGKSKIDNPIGHGFCRSVTSQHLSEIPKTLYKYLTEQKGWSYPEFMALKEETDRLFNELPTDYTPNFYVSPVNSWERGHIANGYEENGFDNIVLRRCQGTYSSMTTGSQNDLSVFLIVCKGFCPDQYLIGKGYCIERKMIEGIYERHGFDSDFSDLYAWAERNPTRCMSNKSCFISREENRDLEGDERV